METNKILLRADQWMNNIKFNKFRLGLMLAALPVTLLRKVSAFASSFNVDKDMEYLNNGKKGTILAPVENVVEDLGRTAVSSVRKAGVAIILVSFVFAAIAVALSSGQKKADAKVRVALVVVAALIMVSGVYVLTTAQSIATNLSAVK